MATTTALAMHNPGILLPPRAAQSSSSTSSYTSGSPDGSASSSSSSRTSLSDLASHSSASTSKPPPYSSASRATSPRRIRFAPLPDPRRAVLITDDGDEVYIPVPDENIFSTSRLLPYSPLAMTMTISSPHAEAHDPDPPPLNDDGPAASSASSTNESYLSSNSSSSASTTSNPKTGPSDYSPMSSVGSSPVIRDTTVLPPIGKSASAPTAPPTAWLKPRNLLHPFRRTSNPSSPVSSSHSLTPTSSIDNSAPTRSSDTNGKSIRARKVLSLTTEEILTLGTINLFRTSSRDSTASSSTAINNTPGWKRWSSSAINTSANTNGFPLTKTQSTTSHKSKSLFSLGGSGSSTSSLSSPAESKSTVAKPRPPALKPFNRHKGTRMLNGRVYGSQRAAALAANPFATARDEEPAFVEWGYGGMGSVKGAKSAGVASGGVNWERLQGGPAVKDAAGVGATGGGGAGDDDDDGSGMGWVKKRKEERERKERERLAALEAAEKEQAPEHSESNLSTPTPTRTSTMDGLKVTDSTPAENANDVATVAGFVLDEAITDEPGAISPSVESAATIVPSYPSAHPVEEVKIEADDSITPLVVSRSKESLKDIKVDENPEEAQQPQEHAPDIVPVPAWSGKHLHLHHSNSYRRHGPGHIRRLSNPASIPTLSSVDGVNGDVMSSGIAENASASTSKVENHSDENDASSSSSASSDSEDEGLGSDEDEEDEEEDEEEKARHEARRKTALGAGVEKVMRHKE